MTGHREGASIDGVPKDLQERSSRKRILIGYGVNMLGGRVQINGRKSGDGYRGASRASRGPGSEQVHAIILRLLVR